MQDIDSDNIKKIIRIYKIRRLNILDNVKKFDITLQDITVFDYLYKTLSNLKQVKLNDGQNYSYAFINNENKVVFEMDITDIKATYLSKRIFSLEMNTLKINSDIIIEVINDIYNLDIQNIYGMFTSHYYEEYKN